MRAEVSVGKPPRQLPGTTRNSITLERETEHSQRWGFLVLAPQYSRTVSLDDRRQVLLNLRRILENDRLKQI